MIRTSKHHPLADAGDLLVGTHMEPLATLLAAVAGAMVAVVIMNGPLWLLAPGALGALLPLTVAKARNRGHE